MDYIEDFELYLDENDKSPITIESYLRDIKQFTEIIQKEIDQVTKKDLRYYIRELKNMKMSVKSINRKLTSLNQYVRFMNEEYDSNITLQIKNQKIQSQDYLEEMLSRDEFEALISSTEREQDYRAKAIFYTLFYTGMRVSEMLQLEVADVEKEKIQIRGKGNKYRNIFIPEKLREVWKEYMEVRRSITQKLFTGTKGPLTRIGIHKIIKKYAKISGINDKIAHAHNFRHLFCISLLEKGFSIDIVADLAGHSNINTTRIYTRKTTSELVEVINQL